MEHYKFKRAIKRCNQWRELHAIVSAGIWNFKLYSWVGSIQSRHPAVCNLTWLWHVKCQQVSVIHNELGKKHNWSIVHLEMHWVELVSMDMSIIRSYCSLFYKKERNHMKWSKTFSFFLLHVHLNKKTDFFSICTSLSLIKKWFKKII